MSYVSAGIVIVGLAFLAEHYGSVLCGIGAVIVFGVWLCNLK
jgi:hypothetical protein